MESEVAPRSCVAVRREARFPPLRLATVGQPWKDALHA